ncbi:hypothetical protein JTB14_002278 [Gonioctena quinquepunctata]|nr:hypothetical protein JTB14_002278 [Gonioctena quinquepunctata]
MDPKRFYNSFQFVNNIPGHGNNIASDSDSDYSPPLRYVSKNKNIEVISETDSETGDDISSTSSSTQKPKRKSVKNNNLQEESKSKQSMPKKDKIIWTEKKLKEYDADKFSFLGETGLPECFDTLESPVKFFSLLFPDDLLDLIVVESNLKSVQDNVNKPANITKNELEQFIGIPHENWFADLGHRKAESCNRLWNALGKIPEKTRQGKHDGKNYCYKWG